MSLVVISGVDNNGQRLINLADGSAATDAVTLQQLQALARGLDWKSEVIAASTGNVNVASPGGTLDGVTLSAGMQTIPQIGTVTRVLLKDQSTPSENGIYDWNGASSALTRSVDSSTGTQLSGSTYTVQRGTVNADRVYRVNTDDPITVGTTALVLSQVGGASSPYTAGNGLTLSGQQFAVQPGNGIIADGTSTRVDPSVVVRKFAQSIGDGSTTTFTVTHNLNTLDVQVTIREVSSGKQVLTDNTAATVNTLSVSFPSAPSNAQYRVIIQG